MYVPARTVIVSFWPFAAQVLSAVWNCDTLLTVKFAASADENNAVINRMDKIAGEKLMIFLISGSLFSEFFRFRRKIRISFCKKYLNNILISRGKEGTRGQVN